MKITKEKFNKLKKFKTVSFALWNDKDFSDTKYIENNLSKLRADIIILGLNPSKDISFLKNFHYQSSKFDKWYKEAFSRHKILRGVFMTDLIAEAEPDSKTIIKKWSADKNKHVKNLKEQLKILGVKNFSIICIGYNTFDLFSSTGIKTICIYKIKHPNAYRQEGARNAFKNDVKEITNKWAKSILKA